MYSMSFVKGFKFQCNKNSSNRIMLTRPCNFDPTKSELVIVRLGFTGLSINGTKAYEETSIDEKAVVYSHSNEIPNKFAVYVKERQDRLPTMYW